MRHFLAFGHGDKGATYFPAHMAVAHLGLVALSGVGAAIQG